MTAIEAAAGDDAAGNGHHEIPGNGAGIPGIPPGLGLVLIMAIVVIYIVLGILYESFTQPLVILSGLPAAGFGALLSC